MTRSPEMTQAKGFPSDPYAVPNFCHRYDGRVAIVTGAAQGLGRVTALRLAEEGASVVIADRQEERGAATSRDLSEQSGQRIIHIGGDLSAKEASEELAQRTFAEFGRIDTF